MSDPTQLIQQAAAQVQAAAPALQNLGQALGQAAGAVAAPIAQAAAPAASSLGQAAGAGAAQGAQESILSDPTWWIVGLGGAAVVGLLGVAAATAFRGASTRGEDVPFHRDPNPTREQKLPRGDDGFLGALGSAYQTEITGPSAWRDLLNASQAPKRVRAEYPDAEFFVQSFGGEYLPLNEFQRGGVEGWDGSIATGWSSGHLVRISRDGDQYQYGFFKLVPAERWLAPNAERRAELKAKYDVYSTGHDVWYVLERDSTVKPGYGSLQGRTVGPSWSSQDKAWAYADRLDRGNINALNEWSPAWGSLWDEPAQRAAGTPFQEATLTARKVVFWGGVAGLLALGGYALVEG